MTVKTSADHTRPGTPEADEEQTGQGYPVVEQTSLGSTDGCETDMSREHIEQPHSGAT